MNFSVLALQFAATHLGYLRLCLEMSYHHVLTASGADKTLTCVSGAAEFYETSPKSGERCQLFKAAANKFEKSGQLNSRNESKCGGTVFVFFLLFILLTAVSGKVMDFCVYKFDKSEFMI